MPEITPDAVREELERILASPGFAGAGRLGPFLRFLVERALASDPVKEAVIGVEVFGRPADYDPRLDPIVRVEARRLRSRLGEYYAGPGAGDSTVIELPKGTYIPVFTARQTAAAQKKLSTVLRRRRIEIAAAIAAILVGGALISIFPRHYVPASHPVVAVLPFVNMSDEKANEYFSDGLTEELIDRLAKVQGLRVVARSSAFQFKGAAQDLREIGRKLNATAVVEGSVRRSGDRLRVAAQLIDVADGLHVWSDTYERKLSDVFAIQDDIARSIASALKAELRVGFPGEAPPPTSNVEAYQLYLKGRHHLNHDALAGLQLAAASFEEAVAKDPKFGAAHALLAVDYGLLGYYMLRPAAEIWPKAKQEAERAISIDPKLGAGHTALGFALGMYDWNWAAAERELCRGVELDPNSSEAHTGLAVACLTPTGRLDEAAAEFARALELDPQFYLANIGAAYEFLTAGRYNEAIAQYQRAIEVNPTHADAQWDLGMAYALAGQKEAAMKQFHLAGQIRDGGSWEPGAMEYAITGDAQGARKRIAAWPEFPKQRPIFIAYCYGALGDAGQTVAWLEKAFAARDPQLIWIKVDPRFAKVRSDPRFQALVKKIVERGS